MASFRCGLPPPSHFGLQYSSVHRPVVVRGLPLAFEPFHKSRAVTVTTPHTKPLEQLSKEKTIRVKLLNTDPPQPSSYDTAWVAMVPAPGCPEASRFPQCVDWILQNQRGDGSWGLAVDDGHHELLLAKDALSSTLACVLALKTWGVGDQLVGKGLRFIGDNLSSVTNDNDGDKPVGFNVIFPSMLERCIGMGLDMPLSQADIDGLFRLRDKELQSLAAGSKAFKAYVAQGLGNWDKATMAFQRRNGSLFNSPATTAAAAIHTCDRRAVNYLDSLVSFFGSSVPTVYPGNLHTQLRMVDALEKIGISRSFSSEINCILDMTHASWLANDEEIMLDLTTCAMAFRLLRMHGYDVSSDGLAQFREESSFHDSIQGTLNDTESLLELHKASQVQIMQEDMILKNIGSWSAKLLEQQLGANKISRTIDPAEVEHVLKHPFYTTLDRLEHRRNITNFKPVGIQMLKSAYRLCLPDKEITSLAAADFQSSQTVYQEELRCIESWVKESRLDELEFARVLPLICYFPSAAIMFPCELSEARMTFSKNSILVTVVDDLFDVAGSTEELENFIELIEKWDAHEQVGFFSKHVEIVFRAIYDTSNQLAEKAGAVQNRSVINHFADLWVDFARAGMAEANWSVRGHFPSFEEYMTAAELTFGQGPIILASLYSMAPELLEDVITCQEYKEMFRHLSVCGRLLNDLQTYEREKEQGQINAVLLLALESGSIEAAKTEVRRMIDASRIHLLRLVLRKESAVPWPCRQVFWNMCKVCHQFYGEIDGFTMNAKDMMHAGKAVVHHPLRVPEKTTPDTSST